MNKDLLTKLLGDDPKKKLLPGFLVLLAGLVIIMFYFSPMLQGQRLYQYDIVQWKGMVKAIEDHREQYGEEPLWTGSLFAGMPAFQVSTRYPSNLLFWAGRTLQLHLPRPMGIVFLCFAGFFFLLRTLKVGPYLSGIGAMAFAFSSYFFIALEAGHNTKIEAVGYIAPILAGVIHTFRSDKKLLWGALTTVFFALHLTANHFQITYYMLFILLCFGISEFVLALQEKKLPEFAKSAAILIAAGLISIGPNISRMWTTYEYAKFTMRGDATLQDVPESKAKDGLDKEYALRWSYGKGETFTLLFPNAYGGGSQTNIGESTETYKLLTKVAGKAQAQKAVKAWPTYYGDQPFTSGPVYVGAIVVFLFLLGLLITDNKWRWWILAATILAVFLSWGRHMMWFTDIFYGNVPMYNKFRTVSMWLVNAEFTMPLLAILGLKKFLDSKEDKQLDKEKMQKSLYIALGLIGGIAVIFGLASGMIYDMFVFSGQAAKDAQRLGGMFGNNQQMIDQFVDAMREDRIGLIRKDALFRVLPLVAITGGLLWAYLNDKVSRTVVVGAVAVLMLVDLVSFDRDYLNKDNFRPKNFFDREYSPSPTDQQILADKDPNFRVLNLAANTFNDAKTSYYHKSVGGYNAAKMRRYQDLIDFHLAGQINQKVLAMLNTKYIIQPDQKTRQARVVPFPPALGHAWFVQNIQWQPNPDSVIRALNKFDPATTAIINEGDRELAGNLTPATDSAAIASSTLTMSQYKLNHLVYESNSSVDQVAIFSEIYYEKGWNAYIDGQPVPHFRTNYLLRGLSVPAGKHTIEFKFEPKSYYTGEKISLAGSLLVLLILFGAIGMEVKKVMNDDQQAGDKE